MSGDRAVCLVVSSISIIPPFDTSYHAMWHPSKAQPRLRQGPHVTEFHRSTASRRSPASVGADSLGHVSQEGLLSAVAEDRNRYCSACFSGVYPMPPSVSRTDLTPFLLVCNSYEPPRDEAPPGGKGNGSFLGAAAFAITYPSYLTRPTFDGGYSSTDCTDSTGFLKYPNSSCVDSICCWSSFVHVGI